MAQGRSRPGHADAPAPSLVAVVSDFPAPSQTFILRKLTGLRDAGVDVTVAATRLGPGAEAHGFGTVALTPWSDPRHAARDPRSLLSAAVAGSTAIARRAPDWRRRVVQAPVRSLDADLVHVEFSGIAVTYLDALTDLSRDRALVVSCRGAAEQIEPLVDPERADALARVFDLVDLVHCVSDDMRRTVEALGAPPAKILVNRPAVPVSELAPLRRPARDHDGPLRVLAVGRLHWKKAHDTALRAVAELARRGVDVELRIVGDGPERAHLTFLVDQLDLADRVTLLGTRTSAEVREELDATDVLLLPSLSEGISNAVLEAMAAGRPVLTTDCGGMREVVDDGVDGLVVPIADVDAVADALERLAADPDLRTRLGAAAAERADRDLDLSRQVATFLDAYRRLVPSWPELGAATPRDLATSAATRSVDRPSV